ncbi:hypothetical protein GQ53DRAFT_747810 [Thozetella sp. PMI_491]|nr:hypothetical protein GQ53DRAFT_747810 [Thozetella sp. PMI_491]
MVLTPDTAGPHSADPISTGSVSAAPVLASQITAEPPQLANQGDTFGSVGVTILPPPPAELFVPTSLLQSDLDQVYFERTHQSVPILHRRHYFSWAQSSSKTRAQNCLQHAIWNSAASLSSHLQPLQESLYQKTQKLLAASNEYPSEALSIEYVQARILMSIHDFMHRSHRQGWLSAGQCFRIVQLMGLHRLDDPLQPPRPDSRDGWIHLEEKRRAFWMAYCVDVLVSKRGMWPLTLHEHVRTTRLPLPDDVFQNDELQDDGHARTQYLHELFESPAQSGQSPFLELIIFCTISRNIASLKRDRLNSCEGSTPTPELFSHHSSLSSTLDQRTEVLQAHHRPSLLRSDPILLFTRMFSHALTLCLCSSLRKTLPTDHEAYDEVVLSWQHRALTAVFGIIDLARSIGSLSYFKMHPFTPLPLAICRDFLNSGLWVSQSGDSQMQELTNLLQDMGGINNVAKDYLAGPELPHVRTT